jgi:hypothetical protein
VSAGTGAPSTRTARDSSRRTASNQLDGEDDEPSSPGV